MIVLALILTAPASTDWSARAYQDTDEERLAFAQRFIEARADTAPDDQLAIAHATVGRILWQRSCPNADGCVSLAPRQKTKRGRFCGPRNALVPRTTRRVAKLAEKAQLHFGQAVELGREAVRGEELDDAVSASRYFALEKHFEALARVHVPELDFMVEEWKKSSGVPKWEREYAEQVRRRKASTAELKAFVARRIGDSTGLPRDYDDLAESGSQRWALAAMARIGELHRMLALELSAAPIPRRFRKEYLRGHYCDPLTRYAAAVRENAAEAFSACLSRAIEGGALTHEALACEDFLTQHDKEYPATRELFGKPEYASTRMQSYPVQLTAQP